MPSNSNTQKTLSRATRPEARFRVKRLCLVMAGLAFLNACSNIDSDINDIDSTISLLITTTTPALMSKSNFTKIIQTT